METKSLVQTAVAVLVAVTVLVTVLFPITSSAQETIGESVTVENTMVAYGQYRLDEVVGDAVITVGTIEGSYGIAVGEAFVPIVPAANTNLISSDVVSVNPNANGTLTAITLANGTQHVAHASDTLVITLTGGVATITLNSQELYVSEYNSLYALKQDGAWAGHDVADGTAVRSINDVRGSGAYKVGDAYILWFINNGHVYGTPGYTFTMSYDEELKEGTTDIYIISNIVITASEEGGEPVTINATRVLTHATVEGHESGGAGYTLIGIIPILVIVGLILAVIGFAIRYRD